MIVSTMTLMIMVMKFTEHKELPRAIEDLFNQIEKKHNIDLFIVLEYAVSRYLFQIQSCLRFCGA